MNETSFYFFLQNFSTEQIKPVSWGGVSLIKNYPIYYQNAAALYLEPLLQNFVFIYKKSQQEILVLV